MADCKKCRFRSICKKRPKMEGATIAECDLFRNDIERTEPMTNADRIRAMSDEELAVWATSIRLDTINEMCKKFDVEIEMPIPTVENTADVCEWLKQPAEENR